VNSNRKYNAILKRIPGCDPGFIYILTNESMPGLLKIGFTKRSPESRAAVLNSTAVPTPFDLAYQQMVRNCEEVEAEVHKRLEILGSVQTESFFELMSSKVSRQSGNPSVALPKYEATIIYRNRRQPLLNHCGIAILSRQAGVIG